MVSRASIQVGQIYPTTRCGDVEIVEYKGCFDITVKFINTGYVLEGRKSVNVLSGQILDPTANVLYGVARIGVGEYRSNTHGDAYVCWSGILNRVYRQADEYTKRAYRDVSVCPDWHNFQNFAKWYYSQPYHSLNGYDLDKDLKIPGNRVYGPETCLLIPEKLNAALAVLNRPNKVMKGVSRYGYTKRYIARLRVEGKTEVLGIFDEPEQAHRIYIKAYAEYLRNLALQMHTAGWINNEILLCVADNYKENYHE